MRSPAERRRVAMERALRVVAMGALAALLWSHAWPLRQGGATDAGARAEVAATLTPRVLARWSATEPAPWRHLAFDRVPDAAARDWLAALGASGTRLTWSATHLAPVAAVVEPVADPARASRVWVAAPAGTRIALGDALGVVDSVTVRSAGALVTVPHLEGNASAEGGGSRAAMGVADSLVLRPVLVLGVAGWEAKFVIAALEERGWRVDARLAIAPSGDVVQGASAVPIDTSRYAAVIALDSSADRYATRIGAYVRAGGALVAAGEGASLASLRALMPATARTPRPAGLFAADSAHPRAALAFMPLVSLASDAVPLERAGAEVKVAARRVARGRVIQSGYRDSWRWRMGGTDADPVASHRAWWASLVSSVAYAPGVSRGGHVALGASADPAPYASLVATLGAPSARPADVGASERRRDRWNVALFAVLLLALLGEWGSRRLGARR